MARKDDNKEMIFFIPKNFEEKSITISGLSYKNISEALVVVGIVAAILWFIPSLEIKTKIIIGAIIGIPLAAIAVVGINNCSLSEFLINFIKFKIRPNSYIKKDLFNKKDKYKK